MNRIRCFAVLAAVALLWNGCKKQEKKGGGNGEPQPAIAGGPTDPGAADPQGAGTGGAGGFSGGGGGSGGQPDPGAANSTDPNAGSPTLSGGTGGSGSSGSTTGGTSGAFSGNGPGKFIPDFQYSSEFYSLNDSFKLGNSPHKKVRVWYSKNVQGGISKDGFGAVPVGTVAIKEFDNDSQTGVDGFAVMIKEDKGYDSSNGDWSYELRDKYGDIENGQRGRVQECISCHNKFKSTDYLAATKSSNTSGGSGSSSGGGSSFGGDGPGSFKSNYRDSADFFTQMTTMYKGSSSAHGRIQIWYSSNIRDQVESNDSFDSVPNGTVAVARYDLGKSSSDNCRPQVGVVAMVKKSSSSTNNGWTFEARTSTGALIPSCESSVSACANCHVKVDRETDYLRGTELRD